jgi:hypothetical protein
MLWHFPEVTNGTKSSDKYTLILGQILMGARAISSSLTVSNGGQTYRPLRPMIYHSPPNEIGEQSEVDVRVWAFDPYPK